MLCLSICMLVVLWLICFSFQIGGGYIHLLLILAAGLFFFDLLTPRYKIYRNKYE